MKLKVKYSNVLGRADQLIHMIHNDNMFAWANHESTLGAIEKKKLAMTSGIDSAFMVNDVKTLKQRYAAARLAVMATNFMQKETEINALESEIETTLDMHSLRQPKGGPSAEIDESS